MPLLQAKYFWFYSRIILIGRHEGGMIGGDPERERNLRSELAFVRKGIDCSGQKGRAFG